MSESFARVLERRHVGTHISNIHVQVIEDRVMTHPIAKRRDRVGIAVNVKETG